jgi:serine/threonine protein kinase
MTLFPPGDDRLPEPRAEEPSDTERTEIRGGEVFAVATTPDILPVPDSSVHELVGQGLDHYRIESLVGVGGMGAVFRGRDQRLDRVVAIKVVPMSHRRAEAMRRFRMEAQSAAKLDHPNIARVFYVGETDRWSYIVFEFIEGTNLRQLVLERGPLSIDDATRFACQVAEALQHAHERGVVHRDIKPSNILIGLDGRAKIVDMGLARTTDLDRSTADLTASGVTLGTFDYISPEQAHDPRDADVRSDIYSLGCTLYFLLTGQAPFPDGTALQKLLMHGTKMPEDPRCFRNDVSDALIAILRKMMAKKPKDRYQEPIDLVNDLRMLAAIDSLDWRHELPEEALHSAQSGRTWWEFSLPGLVCISCIALVTLWLYNENQRSAVYVIPRVEVTEIASSGVDSNVDSSGAANVLPETPRAPTAMDSIVEALPTPESSAEAQAAVTTIVVTEGRETVMSSIRKPYESARTLEEAIARWQSTDAIERIILTAPVTRLQQTIAIDRVSNGRPLRLEGAGSQRPRIILEYSSIRSTVDMNVSWFQINASSVEFRGLDFDSTFKTLDGVSSSLFQVAAGGRLSMVDCTLTAQSQSNGRLPSIVSFRDASAQGSSVSGIQVKRSAIRGQGDLIRVESKDRIEMEIEDSWIALSGSVIDVEGSKSMNRSPRIRMELNHVTSISLSPWIRIRMGASNPYPVAFVRTANESIFSGSTTFVEWDASNVGDWPFAAQAKRIEDLGRWIDLRGLDNVYDLPSMMRLVQVIMSMSSEEVSIDSDSNLLRNERGMELLAAWQTAPPWNAARMHILTPKTTQWSHAGLQPGCHNELLPPFPETPTLP